MKRVVLSMVMLLSAAPVAMAQTHSASPAALGINFAPRAVQDEARRGFTVLVNAGVGIQRDEFYGETSTGFAGLNFGVGWFLTDNIAVLFRRSATIGKFDGDSITQVSDVWGGTAQFWVNPRFAVEAGAGVGRWSDDANNSDTGFGIIVGGTVVILRRGSHNITGGVEYAPVFVDDGTIHNVGVVIGYQFIRR